MINPKIIYIAVVLIFIYIVGKFKIVPYLAARKILKDSKKNGNTAPDTVGNVQPVQTMHSAFPIGMLTPSAVPSPSAGGRYREIYFDYEMIDTRSSAPSDSADSEDREDSAALPDPVKDCEVIDARVNSFLLRLRKHGIYPDTLCIIPIADRVFMAYVVYAA